MDVYLLFVIMKIIAENFSVMAAEIFCAVSDSFEYYQMKANLTFMSDEGLFDGVRLWYPAALDGLTFAVMLLRTLTVVYRSQLIMLGGCVCMMLVDLLWMCGLWYGYRVMCWIWFNIKLRLNPTNRYRELAHVRSLADKELKIARQLESKRFIEYWKPRDAQASREMCEFIDWYEASWFRFN